MNPHTILLVEDDENDVFFFQRAVEKAGVENPLQVVRDGREAVDYLSGKALYSDRTQHPMPGLIVLDLNLPHRNGLEVLQWIRSQPAIATTLIVVLTSSVAERDLHEAYAFGANSYLAKPSNPDRMVDLLALLKRYWLTTNLTPPKIDLGPGAHSD